MGIAVAAEYAGVELEMATLQNLQQNLTMEAMGVRGIYVHSVATISFVVHPLLSQPEPFAIENPPRRDFPDSRYPAAALEALKRKLLVPRQKLKVYAGTRVVLESPVRFADGKSAEVDAVAGPVPLSVTCDEVMADRTMFCTFRIQTWLPTCIGSPGTPPPTLLSNQFRMSVDMAYPEYRQVITTNGTAVFRADFLAARSAGGLASPLVPADFTDYVVPPLRDGFNRTVRITPSGDGVSLDYDIRDEEVGAAWGVAPDRAIGITRCEGSQELFQSTPGLFTTSIGCHLHYQVWGYPGTSSANLVAALLLLHSHCRNRFGNRVLTVLRSGVEIGEGREGERTFFTEGRVKVQFPRRTATFDVTMKLPQALATAWGIVDGVVDAGNLGNLDYWIEDFGPKIGPGVGLGAAGPGPQPPPPEEFAMGIMHAWLMGQCERPRPAGPQRFNYDLSEQI